MSLQSVATQGGPRALEYSFVPPDLSSVFNLQPVIEAVPGQALFWEGDDAQYVFQVEDGLLRALRLLADGRRVIVGFLRPGDLLGVSHKDRYLYTVEAITEARLRRYPRSRFEDDVARQPHLRGQLFSKLCDEMTAAQDQAVLLSRRSADGKVANFLLLMARDGEGERTAFINLPMTRLDIADYLNMTIETVSRTITKFASKGIIIAPDRRSIMVLKWHGLQSIADGDDTDLGLAQVNSKVARAGLAR
ncbi:helix-turn-helix domain-containing protein (plasmid) [Ensifer sp. PDNC004]|uniref:Crp/Fnr family transcriptional regulator n=1 Tax=unclassified Ensifer TaxID=2633371 RepID=UPI001785B976|nr:MULTISPECIES: helix-turn-helix domain-containing protein [unclassified Ensifer]MBD9652849.1 helix-turn-helix domain-containing protein [Ensifer sp. ENS09]QRY64860.1 helix-turn-helix domain-containing protein [Ensifer sp. PDNC004]